MRSALRRTRTVSATNRSACVGLALVVAASVVGCAKPRPVTGAATPATATAAPADAPATKTAATMESANTIDESSFGQQPVSRVEELFIGRFPGVQVLNVNGQVQVRIRGSSSFTANTEPLILIDGQQMTPGSGGLIGLNPRDIKKIEVLKDAVSMAEFGVRGSNGVIRITTKH